MLIAEKLNQQQLDEYEKNMMNEPKQFASAETSWPSSINKLAYQGLPGEIVNTIEPHTESDPVAILIQSLIVFGNVIGRSAHFRVEADRHYTNENCVIVGETAKGRKGTSDGIVNALFTLNTPYVQGWMSDKIKSGLSSGEGITYHVRDAAENDDGIIDKRLFVREPEFGSVLRVIERHGNTLSPVIRQAWDTGNLSILTKNNPIKASDAHISISGHITAPELRHYLYDVEIFNGLANRFIWLCVKRSKMLPEGGRFHKLNVIPIMEKISAAIEFARTVGEVKRDATAREIWIKAYPALSNDTAGMAGAVLSRAEAHVMRLALIYALMDQSNIIKCEHLIAALALWDYIEASVSYIFGDRTGDSIADRIFDSVCEYPEGLTRTEVFQLFHKHEKRERISDAINLLVRCNKVIVEKAETAGRWTEVIKRRSAQAQKA
jgi:hypothetical protein